MSVDIWQGASEQVPLGLLVLDAGGRVRGWNAWLAERTGITADQAEGRTLAEIYPGFDRPRFEWALEQVITSGSPQVLSQTLNHYLLPIRLPGANTGAAMMQQHVQLAPLGADERRCLVSISDVSDNVARLEALGRMASKMREASLRDTLTGVYNRRYMWEWLGSQLAQAVRQRTPLGCLMFDIDHFKQVNDSLGHAMGDQVLIGFATLMGERMRSSDVLVRFGGEEFVALLPQSSLAETLRKAESMLHALRETSIAGLYAGRIRCSVGVAAFDPAYPVTGDELLQQADQQLYKAKGSGRDRACPPCEVCQVRCTGGARLVAA